MSISVGEVIEDQPFITIAPENSVSLAISGIAKYKPFGLVVVQNENVVGTFSERDLLSKVVFHKLDPATTPVGSVMSNVSHTVKKSTLIEECLALMKTSKLRSIPVLGWFSKPVGLITNTQVLFSYLAILQEEKAQLDSADTKGQEFEQSPTAPLSRLKELASKQTVFEVLAEESVMEAIQVFCSANVGCALVTENGKLVGVFSERDVVTRVMAKNLKPQHVKMSDVMTTPAKTVDVSSPVEECLHLMRTIGCRHLPIMENGVVIGVVSIVDCLNWIYADMQLYNEKKREWLAQIASQTY